MVGRDMHDQPPGTKLISVSGTLFMPPTGDCRRSSQSITSGCGGIGAAPAHGDTKDVGRIGLQHDRPADPLENKALILRRNLHTCDCTERQHQQHCGSDGESPLQESVAKTMQRVALYGILHSSSTDSLN